MMNNGSIVIDNVFTPDTPDQVLHQLQTLNDNLSAFLFLFVFSLGIAFAFCCGYFVYMLFKKATY